MPKVNTKLVKWEEVVEWTRKLAEKIEKSKWRPDIIIAIARGGYVPARLLCDFLYINDLVSIQVLHWGKAAEITAEAHVKYPLNISLKGKKVLIVDDICDTGDSVIIAKSYIEKHCEPLEIKVGVMQWISSIAKIKPDFFVEEVKNWVWYQYPWTRLEDTTEFLEKITGRLKTKRISFNNLLNEFKEQYGIDVGEKYYKLAINYLVKKNRLKRISENIFEIQ